VSAPTHPSSKQLTKLLRSNIEVAHDHGLTGTAHTLQNAIDEIERLRARVDSLTLELENTNAHLVKAIRAAHEPKTECEHDMLKPDTTCVVNEDDPYHAHCNACGKDWFTRATVPPATGLERARDVVSDVARGLGGEARVGAILALNAITEAMVGTRASLPPSERPQFEIELPDGDTRKLHVWFTEKRTDGIWHISISVDAATTEPPREGYSLAYADQMRTALLRIAGWREIDRNSLGERLREIEEIAIAALMPTVTKGAE
jgi:hypothetical protein